MFLGGFGEGTLAKLKSFVADPVLSKQIWSLQGLLLTLREETAYSRSGKTWYFTNISALRMRCKLFFQAISTPLVQWTCFGT